MSALPEAILLDLDDTILDDTGGMDSCWADACAEAARRAPGIDALALRSAIGEYADQWWSDPARNRAGRLELRAATREITAESFLRLGHDDPGLAHEISDYYRDLREERARLNDGAIEAIEWFRGRGIRLGMMTNGGAASQRAKIDRFGLAPYFDHIIVEGEFGCGKPDRRVYDALLTALRVHPGNTWAIGDNLQADVLGPMELGIYGIWVDHAGRGLPEGTTPAPDRTIRALRELVETA